MKKKLSILLVTFFCATAFSFNYFQTTKQQTKKKITTIESYTASWARVDSLSKKGLNKSALEIVMKIYNKSKAENNTPEFLKAVIQRMKFTSYTEEDNIKKSIADLKKDCAETSFPANAILHSMLAETYWSFYQQNRWKFINRTETVDFKSDDINTWDLKKIFEQTVNEYRRSLDNSDKEMKVQVNIFDEVITNGNTSEARKFRPTLYDFLAHRAVDFYMNEESGLTQPVNKYKIDAAWYLNDTEMFLNFALQKEDTLNLKYNAIMILQDLLRFHLNDAHPGALIDVNLKRLKFVFQQLTISNKDSLYRQVLQQISTRYKDYPGSTDALFEIASLYFNKGNNYTPGDSGDNRFLKQKADFVCDTAIARFPYSQGGLNCKHLKAQVNEKFISFQAEKVNVPEHPFLGSVKYLNVNKIYARIVRMDQKDDAELSGIYGERLVKFYLNLPMVKEWNIDLVEDGDKQTHISEFNIPALPVGKYAILISSGEKFTYEKNSVSWSTVYVSKLSYVNRRENGEYDIYTLNRTTGEPMQNVQATVYTSNYNYTSRKYETVKGKSFTSDNEGYINLPGENDYHAFSLELDKDNDHLFLNDNLSSGRYDTQRSKQLTTTFFTDRAIYRPGQTIYFKGIVLETDGDVTTIKSNTRTTVGLYDVNSQKISEQEFTTNEYGTFNGTFTAPQGVLTGMMRIQNENGTRYFSVEEYKRPKFEVTFEPLQGSFMVNNRITVSANAKSYSGADVSEAKVAYRVTRSAHFPKWFYYWRGYFPGAAETEMTSGETTTNENGKLSITFDALADEKMPKESNPVFDFQVTADVTDVNGETHSSSQIVSVSYKALFIETDLKETVNREQLKTILIQSRNMAGNFEGATGSITISRLEQPDKLFRNRLTEAPDRHTIGRQEFQKDFPYDIFENENEPATWKKEAEILHSEFDTRKDSIVNIPGAEKLKQGNYIIEIKSKDKFSNDVQYIQYFSLFSPKEKECAVDSFWSFIPIKTKGEPGETAQFLIGSADKNVRVLYEIEQHEKFISRQWITLNNEQKLLEIPITESHRGNFTAHFTMVKQNRFYKTDQVVVVPWSNKEITLSIETFRNKLLPGAKEDWRIKLSGKFSDKIAAEMLASMYDASLDAFQPHQWDFNVWNSSYSSFSFQSGTMFSSVSCASFAKEWNTIPPMQFRTYDELNWFGYSPYQRIYAAEGLMSRGAVAMSAAPMMKDEEDNSKQSSDKKYKESDSVVAGNSPTKNAGSVNIQPRRNFSETAFFYPTLMTNEKNEVIFSFTMPEALTRWKFMALAHTKNLEYGMIEKEIITQKELMVVPNAPRFLREGDSLGFPCKITNLSDSSLSGIATLTMYDPLTDAVVTSQFLKGDSSKAFMADKGGNTSVSWPLSVPFGISAVKYRVTAQAQKFSDGEEQVIPVLTNRMLVTESMPLWANSKQTKSFSFDKLKNNNSSTLVNHKLTLEFTSNPAWYAIQALPYLMEYPYECAEQVFSRYYSNALASHVANSSPKIKAVLDAWRSQSPSSFLSNLEKNQELKSAILEETPWVLDAKDETERKKRVALLFDLNKMSGELQSALLKLQKKQNPDGSWSWFDGMPDDRYITQYIVEGFGHLDHLGVKSVRAEETQQMLQRAIDYLDRRINEDYRNLISSKTDLTKNNLTSMQVHYLYARSFFKDVSIGSEFSKSFDYYLSQEKKYWLDHTNEYLQSMISLTLFKNKEAGIAMDIIKSLKENSQYSDELGRYWKNNVGGYYWGLASIETQSILIEAFHDVARDKQSVDEMQRWLLKNKQTNDWKTTKATAEACYALLLQGTDFLSQSTPAEITIGDERINAVTHPEINVEAGTGYFKIAWDGKEIKPSMADVKVVNNNEVPGWGALYWQYFEQLDKITTHETPLKLQKQLFVEQNSLSGKIIVPVSDQMEVKVSDRLKVRIELRVDRDMEYVMMRDMRASGLEPENVFSSYKWQDGLGYYESTHDASTDFFFSYLPKGTYVFEYPLRASQEGNFSNGITIIQCMYAPEFGAHSEGIRLLIGQ
ncbi:MAG: alpha-2-macroglobulin family protein [Bacteroidota bacterium]